MMASRLCVMVVAAVGAAPIDIYDLTPTLRFDPNDAVQVAAAWDEAHLVATLQGVVNRAEPRLYVRFVKAYGKNVDDYWLTRASEPGQWLAGRERRTVPNLEALIERYRGAIRGVVLYDPKVAATSNLASTIAGVEDLVAVRYDPTPGSVYSRVVRGGPTLPVVRRLLHEDGSSMFTGEGTIPGTDIPSTKSAKCDAYLWLKHEYLDTGKVDAGYAGYYIDAYWMQNPTATARNHHTLTNHDFFVAKKALFFDLHAWADEAPVDDPNQPLGTDLATCKTLLRGLYDQGGKDRMIHIGGFTPWAHKYTDRGRAGGKHGGVPTEWEFTKIVSAYNGFIDADAIGMGAIANASFWMHYPLKNRYPQRWVTKDDLTSRGYLTEDGKVKFGGRDFIIFYVGDFDSAAWVYQFMPTGWDHPSRGKVPLMWCVSPVAERRVPMVLDYLRRTASPNDYFASADNGAGYLNPGMLQEPRPISGLPSGLDAWARHCEPIYRRWGITVTGFIIDGYCPGLNAKGLDCYARFSPNGIVPQKIPPTLLHGTLPVLRADADLPGDPERAIGTIIERVAYRDVPFHWFRAILQTPDWYAKVVEGVRARNPKIELLDGPTFFELYRIWLQNHPDAAAGKMTLRGS
jgi:hypothetical protein